jgi:polyferredoxin
MTTTRKLLLAYAVVALLTLIFQIHVRSGVCGDGCTLSYAKAVVWAIVWPVSWVVYISGMLR